MPVTINGSGLASGVTSVPNLATFPAGPRLANVNMPVGSVLQVVSTTITSTFSSTATSATDITGFTVSITPSSTSSKILVLFSCVGASTNSFNLYLVRNGSLIDLGTGASYSNSTIGGIPTGNASYAYSWNAHYLDSPATTSSVTYKIQGATDAGTFYIGKRNDTFSCSPSTITVMEIAG